MSYNEWDQLKKVIVGVADHAKIPDIDISLRCVNYADKLDETEIIKGPYPQRVIDETNEDLNLLAKLCQQYGAEVPVLQHLWGRRASLAVRLCDGLQEACMHPLRITFVLVVLVVDLIIDSAPFL